MKPLAKGYKKVPGHYYDTPKEVWNFLTRASSRSPLEIARRFLAANHELLGIAEDLDGFLEPRVIESLGAHHVIVQQSCMDVPIHRAYVSVHMDLEGRVYLVKNRAVPHGLLPRRARFIEEAEAIDTAREQVFDATSRSRPVSLHRIEKRWYPYGRHLSPAYRVLMTRREPKEDWVVYVRASSGYVIDYFNNLHYARRRAQRPRVVARLFDPNPVTALNGHEKLGVDVEKEITAPPPKDAYRWVTLRGLDAGGGLVGRRVDTSRTAKPYRARRRYGRYAAFADSPGFEQVMAYYHIDGAIRFLERLGYKGRLRIFKEPVLVNANGSNEDNAWYSAFDRLITIGTGQINDGEDGEVIVHELGHALQDAIVPNWGASREAKAMGEGFGDYFAATYFYRRKPEKYRDCVMSWNGVIDGIRARRHPPCQRFMNLEVTYKRDYGDRRDVHTTGSIWAATLWDIRAELVGKYGEKMGSRRADRIVIESHFQLDGYTKFSKGARAILDADRNLHGGDDRRIVERVFRRRQIEWRK